MGKRRMLAKEIMLQDKLDELDPIYFKLYTLLNLSADDDGIVGNPRMVAKMTSCSPSLLEVLIKLGYLLQFEDGSVAITHWHIHNLIRKNRYKPSIHTTVRKHLRIQEDGTYAVDGDGLKLEVWQSIGEPLDVQCASQDKISEDKESKVNISKDKISDDKAPAASEESSESSDTDFEKSVLEFYKSCCPSLPECKYITEDMRKNIRQLKEHNWDAIRIKQAFYLAEDTEYLKGGGKDGWWADLGWLCKEDNLHKLLNGKYKGYSKQPEKKQATIHGCSEPGVPELEAIQKLLRDDDPDFQVPGLQQ